MTGSAQHRVTAVVECAGKGGSVSVLDGFRVLENREWSESAEHSQNLLRSLIPALESCGLTLADVGEFWLSAGPGSFTALRIACSVTKTLAYALNLPVTLFSSLELLAQASRSLAQAAGAAWISVAVPARRGMVFSALFGYGDAGVVRRVTEDGARSEEDVQKLVVGHAGAGAQLVWVGGWSPTGPSPCPRVAAAEFASLYRDNRIATIRGDALFALEPNYGRPAEAEFASAGRNGR